MPVPLALLLALCTSIRATLLVLTGRYLSSIAQKAHFKRQLEMKGRILPSAWMPVPLALPTPLIAALRALKVGVPFLQRCHTLTVWLRALHQAPISAVHTQSLLHCQKADSSVMPSQVSKHAFYQGHVKQVLHSLCYKESHDGSTFIAEQVQL